MADSHHLDATLDGLRPDGSSRPPSNAVPVACRPQSTAWTTSRSGCQTDRLLLRPVDERDVEPLADLYADPEVVRYLRPLDRDGTRRQLKTFTREWHERGFGPFAITDRSTGQFLGRSGLHYWPDLDETEVGWVLRRGAWGQGYATEAGRASLDWGFREHRLCRIIAIVAVDNAASRAVAGRLGMTVLRHDEIFDRPVIVYTRSAPGAGNGLDLGANSKEILRRELGGKRSG